MLFFYPAYSVNFKRTSRHPRPFRPSHLIHAPSQNHFTEPNEPDFDQADDEEFARPGSVISVGKYHISKNKPMAGHLRNDAMRPTRYTKEITYEGVTTDNKRRADAVPSLKHLFPFEH